MDKKADKINTLIDTVISIIKTMAVLEVMITVIPRVVWKKWLRKLEKDYETMTA